MAVEPIALVVAFFLGSVWNLIALVVYHKIVRHF